MTVRSALPLALAAAAALAVAAAGAPADPPVRYSTCDHAGISSATLKRHVNYLSVQTWLGCAHAQNVARIWVHSHSCGAASCNIWEGSKAIAYCTSSKDSGTTNEWTTRCSASGSSSAVLIGWVRTS